MHRGRGGLMLVAAGAFCLIIMGTVGDADAGLGLPLSAPGGGGGLHELGCIDLIVPLNEERFGGAFLSCSNPYMLEDVVSSSAFTGFRTPSLSMWAGWSHLGHPLYREDRLALSLGYGLPVGGIFLEIAPAVARREVAGFPAMYSRAVSLGGEYGHDGPLAISFRGTPYDEERGAGRETSVSFTVRARTISVCLDRALTGEEKGDTRLALAAALHEKVTLFSGYRSMTDELMSGLAIKVRPVLLSLSWTHHPSLGMTASAGFGGWWAW